MTGSSGEDPPVDGGADVGPRSQRTWTPLLDPDTRARAGRWVDRIAEALLRPPPSDIPPSSLAFGDAGLALFFACLALDRPGDAGERYADRACDLLFAAVDSLDTASLDATLYGGYTGLAWVVEQFQDRLLEPDGDPNRDVDQDLARLLDASPWPASYDLVLGLVGVGVYFLDRLPRPTATRELGTVVERLRELAESRDDGTTWFTPPHLVPDADRLDCRESGYYNLGMAHGVPGVVAFLAQVVGAGCPSSGSAEGLLTGAVPWLLARRGSGRPGSTFGYFVGPEYWLGSEPRPARVAWCYGDPGAAVALLWAALATGNRDWEEEALEVLRTSASVPPEHTGVVDPGLCHGSAGLAHLFNRAYQATGDETLGEAARFWFRRTLERIEAHADRPLDAWDALGYLTGAAGTALALLSATSEQEPFWDRPMLLAPPCRAGVSSRSS